MTYTRSLKTLALTLGFGLPLPADAILLQGTPRDFADRLFLYEHVFVGTVDSAQFVKWVPDTPCGKGLGPFDSVRLVLRVEESLHGDTLKHREVLWSDSHHAKLEGRVGQRVIAWGNRSCPVNWSLWGNVLTLSDTVFQHPDGVIVWEEDGPEERGSSLLARFRERLEWRHATEHAFDTFDGLALARVESWTNSEDFGVDMRCSWIRAIAGKTVRGSVLLRVRAIDGCSPVGVGDSLLVPWNGADPPREMTLSACIYRFRVRDGVALGPGLDLADVPARIERRGKRYGLPVSPAQ